MVFIIFLVIISFIGFDFSYY